MSIALNGTLVLLGAGKMGGAMLEGWLKAGVRGSQVAVLDPVPSEGMKALVAKAGARLNPPVAELANAEVLVVAVKPQIMEEAIVSVVPLKRQRPLILSVAAGKTIASFAHHFGDDAAIIRSIPNTPAAIGRGITAMAANAHVTQSQLALARNLLSAVGEVVEVSDESQIDAVTAVSGSGPAYIFYVTECLTAAAEKLGLAPDVARQLARATVAGAGELMRVTGEDAATLRQNVTSPKGTTYAALQVLMAGNGLQPLFDKAVEAAAIRSRELAG